MDIFGPDFSLSDFLGVDLNLDLNQDLNSVYDIPMDLTNFSLLAETPVIHPAPVKKTVHPCDKCGKRFLHRKSVLRHQRSHCQPPLALAHYDTAHHSRTFTSNHYHTDTKDPLETDNCLVCGHTFSCPDKLLIHKEEQHSRLQCCKCQKTFPSKGKLVTHHRSHTKQRPFSCSLCEKRFTEESSIRKHVLTHRPPSHQCRLCQKRFVRKDYLEKHTKSNVCLKLI